MSKCSELCGLLLSMCNTSMRCCSICRMRTCPYNFALSRGAHCGCRVEEFLEPFAREAGMDYLELRDKIESQFKKGMFWGNFGWVWWIDRLTPCYVCRGSECWLSVKLKERMTSLVPFIFNNVKLFTVTINGKVWTRAKEVVQGALKYQKKTADVIRDHCSRENYAHKYQLSKFPAAGNLLNLPSDSRKDDYYINEEGMNELVFTSQQPKAKAFRKYCCNELFPQVRQLLVDKLIEEKDTQLALLNDDLVLEQERARQLDYNTGLQEEIRAKDQELAVLRQRHVPLLESEEKNYGITIIAKNNESAEYPFISICGNMDMRSAWLQEAKKSGWCC